MVRIIRQKHIKNDLTLDAIEAIDEFYCSRYICILIESEFVANDIKNKFSDIVSVPIYCQLDEYYCCITKAEFYKNFYKVIELEYEVLVIIPLKNKSLFKEILKKNIKSGRECLKKYITNKIIIISSDDKGYFLEYIKEFKLNIFKKSK